MIPIKDCKPWHLYLINARNADCGVFRNDNNNPRFTIRREKCGHVYLFDELHWEVGPPFGTAIPIKELEEMPEEFRDNDADFLKYLEEAEERFDIQFDVLIGWIKKSRVPITSKIIRQFARNGKLAERAIDYFYRKKQLQKE